MVMGYRCTSLVSLAGVAAGGAFVGSAALYGILLLLARRSTGLIMEGPAVAAAEAIPLPCEGSHSITASQFDTVSSKATAVADELGHYKELVGILRDQIANVSVETEGAALDILTRLNEIDRHIQDMISFLNHADTFRQDGRSDGSDGGAHGDRIAVSWTNSAKAVITPASKVRNG